MQFSVLMSIYKATLADDLNHCLDSLTAQSLAPDQIVLVRDGPVDSNVEKCIKHHAQYLPLRQLHFPQNRGLGPALRDGLYACDHNFIARVDTDDWSVPERFALQVEYLVNNPSTSVVGGWLKEYYPGADPDGVVRQTPLDHMSIERVARRRNPLNHPTVMFRKSDVLASGNYEPCPLFEDYFLWARMLMSGYHLASLPHVLVETKVDPSFFSRRGGVSYVIKELNLMKKLRNIGFLSPVDTSIFTLSRLPMRLLPLKARQHFYQAFLRHK